MKLLLDLMKAAVHDLAAWDCGQAIQQAMADQKRLDLFDIQCQQCGGLGVVADLSRPFGVSPALGGGMETLYGSKICPECNGLGSPRP